MPGTSSYRQQPRPASQNKTAAAVPSSADAHPVLIELFTSEGCSSCPPADVFLQKLDASQPIAGAQLIVLSEHVTAWDHDGWKDPNSSSSLTDRQISYATAHRLPPPATPQLIVDGTQELRLGDPKQMQALLEQAAATAKVPLRIGEVTLDAANPSLLRAHIETDINSEKHGGDVFVAIALDHVESQVLKGENGGKHLVHVAVVQQITKVGKLPKGKTFSSGRATETRPRHRSQERPHGSLRATIRPRRCSRRRPAQARNLAQRVWPIPRVGVPSLRSSQGWVYQLSTAKDFEFCPHAAPRSPAR